MISLSCPPELISESLDHGGQMFYIKFDQRMEMFLPTLLLYLLPTPTDKSCDSTPIWYDLERNIAFLHILKYLSIKLPLTRVYGSYQVCRTFTV